MVADHDYIKGFIDGQANCQDKIDGAKKTISRLDNEVDGYKDKIKAYNDLIADLWDLV